MTGTKGRTFVDSYQDPADSGGARMATAATTTTMVRAQKSFFAPPALPLFVLLSAFHRDTDIFALSLAFLAHTQIFYGSVL